MTLKMKVTWHLIGNVTSLDFDIYLIYLLSKVLLYYLQYYRFMWKDVVYYLERIWLEKTISIHGYVYNSDF